MPEKGIYGAQPLGQLVLFGNPFSGNPEKKSGLDWSGFGFDPLAFVERLELTLLERDAHSGHPSPKLPKPNRRSGSFSHASVGFRALSGRDPDCLSALL